VGVHLNEHFLPILTKIVNCRSLTAKTPNTEFGECRAVAYGQTSGQRCRYSQLLFKPFRNWCPLDSKWIM